ncbi:hypothetical protein [Vagococcus salmoninarum]|uniref:hypothetical protein n=1 Tax=Vagococcus salmoninarum TaxID=2739 RepID=UPI003F96F0E3
MKTEAGRRIISLDDDIISVLRAWKEHQEFMENYDFVISYTGTPLGKLTINRIARRYAALENVKEI